MAEVTRTSGITVSVTGAASMGGETAAPKRSIEAARRAGAGPSGDDLIIGALLEQDLELVDSVPLHIAPAARPKTRGAAAPASAAVTLDVPLAANEHALVLLDDEGEYRWIVDGKPLSPAPPSRRGPRMAAAPQRRVRFSVALSPAAPAPAIGRKRGGVQRNLLVDKLAGEVTAHVFRFAVGAAGKQVIKFLERNVEQGLVAIREADPQRWRLLGDDEAPPVTLPADRPARVLLLVHGTFSSTVGSFGALGIVPEGRDFIRRAIASYDAVLGFDHPTLSVDPLKNAADLLARLRRVKWPYPPQIEMIAYSRGGLVARSLIEQVRPASRWSMTIGRVVFVGCTNGGTQLAEPDNWHRFADHYTNLALGATRALSLIPGAQGWTTIASQVIRGVGALVKALATGVVTDKLAPGLAAMEPDGEFVTGMNRQQTGQPAAADAQYYAVVSNFEPGAALRAGSAPELPRKLLMRIADWGSDELYREANDLVVHVRSMTQIDPAFGDYVKGTLDYGSNGVVYHTNYFTRDATAAQLKAWFGLGGAGRASTRRAPRTETQAKDASTVKRRAAQKPAQKKAPVKKRQPKKPQAKKPRIRRAQAADTRRRR